MFLSSEKKYGNNMQLSFMQNKLGSNSVVSRMQGFMLVVHCSVSRLKIFFTSSGGAGKRCSISAVFFLTIHIILILILLVTMTLLMKMEYCYTVKTNHEIVERIVQPYNRNFFFLFLSFPSFVIQSVYHFRSFFTHNTLT
jgi:hypothetical protein